MSTITADNLQAAIISLIKNIVPSAYPTKRFVDISIGRDSRNQRHEDRIFALIYQSEDESRLCLGARQLQLALYIGYTNDVIRQDINKIKQTLLEWKYAGVIQADTGPAMERYGEEGETSKQIIIPVTIDYKPPEL